MLTAGYGPARGVGAGGSVCAHVATGGPVHLVLSLRKASGRVVQGGVGRAMPCHAMRVVCVYAHIFLTISPSHALAGIKAWSGQSRAALF